MLVFGSVSTQPPKISSPLWGGTSFGPNWLPKRLPVGPMNRKMWVLELSGASVQQLGTSKTPKWTWLSQTRRVWDCHVGLPPQKDPQSTTPGRIYGSPMAVSWSVWLWNWKQKQEPRKTPESPRPPRPQKKASMKLTKLFSMLFMAHMPRSSSKFPKCPSPSPWIQGKHHEHHPIHLAPPGPLDWRTARAARASAPRAGRARVPRRRGPLRPLR